MDRKAGIVFVDQSRPLWVKIGAKTSATTVISLMRMLIEGPEVSLSSA